MPNRNNQRYFNALLENDSKTIEEIYDKVFPILNKYIKNNNGNEDDAWDIFQEAILVLLKMGKKQIELKSDFCSYLLGICRNKWLNHLRKVKSTSSLDEKSTFIEGESLILHNDNEQFKNIQLRCKAIYSAYQKLPDRCKKILEHVIKVDEIGEIKEIANSLGLNYGYFRKEKCECRKKLIRIIKESTVKTHEYQEEEI